jgi:phospholipase/lecithinase/hemolysin
MRMLVFGDSLSDVGNAHGQWGDEAFPCPPHWHGRRCDGPLWVERLAARLGMPEPRPSRLGGDVHAWGGARSGAGLSPGRGAPNLLEQIGRWRAGRGATPVDPRTLVVLRAGANDYLDASIPAVAERVNTHLLAAVEHLAAAGLRRFLVPSELPWGCSPIALPGVGPAERAALNAAIAAQNAALREALRSLAARRGLQVAEPDFHGVLLKVRADPAAHGYREIERPALLEPRRPQVAPDAGGFLWWDGWGHLTSGFHGLLADEAAVVVGA